MEENLNSKREELEEKNNLLESAQEQLAEANAQIAMLKSAPDSNGKNINRQKKNLQYFKQFI